MEVTEVGVRLIRRYWLALTIAIAVPIVLVGFYVVHAPATYTSHVRLMAAPTVPTAQAQADAVVSQVQAVATSRDVVAAALSTTSWHRDPVDVIKALQVTGVGSSGVVDISYTDTSATSAQQIVAAIGDTVVKQIADIHSGLPNALDDLDALITDLGTQRASIQAGRPGPNTTTALAATDRLITDLTNDRTKLAQLDATAAAPTIVDSASPPPADRRGLATRLAVAGLLGLAIGLLFVGANETLRPGVTGAGRVARLLQVPTLGRVGSDPAALADIGRRLRLASRRADVGVIVLMRADRVTIAPELVERMQAATLRPEPIATHIGITLDLHDGHDAMPAGGATATRTLPRAATSPNGALAASATPRQVCTFDELDSSVEGDRIGVVVLATRSTRLTAIQGVRDLVTAAGWPLLGVLDDPRNRSGA